MNTSNNISTPTPSEAYNKLPRKAKSDLSREQITLNNIAKELHKFENSHSIDEQKFMELACTWSLLDSQLSQSTPDITPLQVRKTAIEIKKFSDKVFALSNPEKAGSTEIKTVEKPKNTSTAEVKTVEKPKSTNTAAEVKSLEKPRITRPSLPPKTFAPVEGGPIGFTNLGNTCYLNTAVQLLFNISEFRDFINREGPNATKGELLSTLHALLNIKKDSNSVVHLRKLLDMFLKKDLDKDKRRNGQKDAYEAMMFILGELNWNSMTIENHYQSLEDPNLNSISDRTSTNGLQIELKDSKTAVDFQDVINGYFQEEIMPPDAHVTIDNEEVYNVKKTPVMIGAPSHLIISLKRFNNASRKIATPVRFPASLTVEIPQGRKKIQYEIVGYGNHGGSAAGGHYTASVKNCQDPEDQKRWIKCNDSRISEETPARESSAAYLVLLKRKND